MDAAALIASIADALPEVACEGVPSVDRHATLYLPRDQMAVAAPVLRLTGDPSWTVRRQLAASLGALPAEARIAPAVAILTRDGNDPIVVDALVSSLSGLESRVLQQVAQQATAAQPQGPVEAVEILAAAVVKGGDVAQVQLAIDAATNAITRVAGNGTSGFSGDGGPATQAQLASPRGIAVDGQVLAPGDFLVVARGRGVYANAFDLGPDTASNQRTGITHWGFFQEEPLPTSRAEQRRLLQEPVPEQIGRAPV